MSFSFKFDTDHMANTSCLALFISPYSPGLNPTEHLWEEIREKWFENKVFLSIDAVVDTLEQALHTLENDNERVQNLSGFDWIISGI